MLCSFTSIPPGNFPIFAAVLELRAGAVSQPDERTQDNAAVGSHLMRLEVDEGTVARPELILVDELDQVKVPVM